ncbi:hypothetical protein AB205_0143680 [Aquarana catesbeiana]|uniref:Uncharacterized protein n=1 Tax=Aquarana catesbeiana TaxID=8400 RepID=A0A2G9PU17_AQUCT|nr:hypothetical protein AB205_0143680 [Aquarana catesbeiana]
MKRCIKIFLSGWQPRDLNARRVSVGQSLRSLKANIKNLRTTTAVVETWKWYDTMDAIYGHRPANQGREGGLDSATVIFESIIDPFETSDEVSKDASNFSDDGPSTSFSSTSTISSSQPQSSQPQSTPNAPRHTGERRWLQMDLRTVMEDMRASEGRRLERIENLSERRF